VEQDPWGSGHPSKRCDAAAALTPTLDAGLAKPFVGWQVGLYPDAAEAIAVFRSGMRVDGGWGADFQDPMASRRVAARRAKTKIRRYCAANRLNRLGTLTYAAQGCHEPQRFREHVGHFFRELRRGLGGQSFPYLWTGEWHKTGHGLHAHFAVARYIPRQAIEQAWPHGFVHIKLLGDLPYQASTLDQARVAARYLAKYVGKSLDDHQAGLHRYEVAQRFAPKCEGALGLSPEEVLAWAAHRMGVIPSYVKPSSEWTAYEGPPAVFASWT
jgi:hypothetical protein